MKKLLLISFIISIFIHFNCTSTETTESENSEKQNDLETNFTQNSIPVDQCTVGDPNSDLQTEREKSLYYYASSEKYKAMYNRAVRRERMLANELNKERNRYARIMNERKCMRNSIDEMQTALNNYKQRELESEARIDDYKRFVGRFKSMIDNNTLDVKMIDGRMVVVLSTDVLFPSASKRLSKKGKNAIVEITKILKDISDKRFQIEGHTDSDKYMVKGMTNWELAALRALTVLHTMLAQGMPADRISAASYGASKPMTTNDTEENKAKNRRIEIVVVPDLTLLPGFDELNKLSTK